MNSTKNILFLSSILTMALLTSFSVNGMELNQPINPYLTTQQKTLLERHIQVMQSKMDKTKNESVINIFSEIIETYKEIYYGNTSYTDTELHNAMKESIQRIATEKRKR